MYLVSRRNKVSSTLFITKPMSVSRALVFVRTHTCLPRHMETSKNFGHTCLRPNCGNDLSRDFCTNQFGVHNLSLTSSCFMFGCGVRLPLIASMLLHTPRVLCIHVSAGKSKNQKVIIHRPSWPRNRNMNMRLATPIGRYTFVFSPRFFLLCGRTYIPVLVFAFALATTIAGAFNVVVDFVLRDALRSSRVLFVHLNPFFNLLVCSYFAFFHFQRAMEWSRCLQGPTVVRKSWQIRNVRRTCTESSFHLVVFSAPSPTWRKGQRPQFGTIRRRRLAKMVHHKSQNHRASNTCWNRSSRTTR